ncbi:outer membrane beta-barrel domain-containing protein [Myxococcota bacterium]|nr:outer membrane beta-barrel domain-containing protein [Myxococcota bacterium]MBU1535298.1 outer membrane beta-barrel domain-containing protein [Myxococcota bacterium]
MKLWFTTFLTIVALATAPTFVAAQGKGKKAAKKTGKDVKKPDSKGADDIKIEEDEDGPPTTGTTKKPVTKPAADDVDVDVDVDVDSKPKTKTPGKTGTAATKNLKTTTTAALGGDERGYWSDIKVVPRKLILKQKRVELIPYMGITMNDNLIRHFLLGGEFSYYLSDALSFGVGGHAYVKQQTDRAYLTGLQQRALPTLNQYLYSATVNANYEAAYGKMAIHNKKILQWGIFLTGGLGVTGTEVIPRNAGHEPWSNTNITILVGVGFRIFISKWLTLNASVRNYMMQDKFENSNRDNTQASAEDGESNAAARFINNIVFQIGISVFFPTDFTYTTFK